MMPTGSTTDNGAQKQPSHDCAAEDVWSPQSTIDRSQRTLTCSQLPGAPPSQAGVEEDHDSDGSDESDIDITCEDVSVDHFRD